MTNNKTKKPIQPSNNHSDIDQCFNTVPNDKNILNNHKHNRPTDIIDNIPQINQILPNPSNVPDEILVRKYRIVIK
jgi:hypothetical protein